MNKKEALSTLKARCYAYLKKYTLEENEEKIKIYTTIQNILNDDDSFKKIDTDFAFKILKDLSIGTMESIQIYRELLK